MRVAGNMIDIAGGDLVKGGNVLGLGSPMAVGLASRGFARCRLGRPGWRKDFAEATELSKKRRPGVARDASSPTSTLTPFPSERCRAGADVVREIDAAAEDGRAIERRHSRWRMTASHPWPYPWFTVTPDRK